MKKNSLAVAFLAVSFLFPVQSFAETAKFGDVTWGFRTDKRLNDMTSLWEPKQIGILDKKTGVTHVTTITKVACVLEQCLYRTEYQGTQGKKQEMQVFDIEDVLPKNSGNKKISMGDKDVAENAKKLGVDKEKLKKALEDENEYQRLFREIQVKKEQQRRKEEEEKEKNKNNGTTGNGGGGGGGSHGGGGSNGGGGSSARKIEIVYVNSETGAISDTFSGACSGKTPTGFPVRIAPTGSGGVYCQAYDPNWPGGRALGASYIDKYDVSTQDGDCRSGSNMTFGKKSNGTFSVVCTVKSKDTNFDGASVGSLGGSSAGGSGSGSGAPTASAGGASSQNSATGTMGTGTGTGTTGTGTGTTGTGTGTGSDSSGDLGDMPSAPDGGGEPDWGGLKSDGEFGKFSPSSSFSTGGYCPQDIQLDFGQFGRHSLTLSFVCEAAEKLRYVFITLAYFTAAMMIFKTVNMKG